MASKGAALSSRVITFIAMMGALGNILSAFSIGLTMAGTVGLDLSLIAVFIAAIYGGPFIGFVTGLISGIVPGIYFGFLAPMGGQGWLALIGLPIGKSLTGLTTGSLYKVFNVNRKTSQSIFTIPIILVGYIPECFFTVFYFLGFVPFFLGWISIPLLITILIKAWLEVAFMSVLMGALAGNGGFKTFMANFLPIKNSQPT